MSHNHTFRHAGSYKYRVALTFVKPRGGVGQNGRLKCPLGFLVYHLATRPSVVSLSFVWLVACLFAFLRCYSISLVLLPSLKETVVQKARLRRTPKRNRLRIFMNIYTASHTLHSLFPLGIRIQVAISNKRQRDGNETYIK